MLHTVAAFAGHGGVQHVVRRTARETEALGHEVRILSIGGPEGWTAVDRGVLIENIPVDRRVLGRYRYSSQLPAALRRHSASVDVVHAHRALVTPTLLAGIGRRPLVLSPYLHPGEGGALATLGLTAISRRARRVVCLSQAEGALFREVARRSADVDVVWPGTETATSGPRPGIGRPLVLAVARLVPHKRLHAVIDAFVMMKTDADLAIVGEGPERARLAASCRRAGLEPDDVLLGAVSSTEVDDLYDRADVVISLSSEESFGLTLTEGIASGAAIVCSDIPSHREIVTTCFGSSGGLVPVTAPPAITGRALDDALARPNSLIQTPPTWRRRAEELVKIYRSVLR